VEERSGSRSCDGVATAWGESGGEAGSIKVQCLVATAWGRSGKGVGAATVRCRAATGREQRGSRSWYAVATAWGGLPRGACGESRGRGKQVRRGGLARRGERASSDVDDSVDDSVAAVPHTPHHTKSRVGSRGPVLCL
jgi:hypothetical protein